MAARFVTETARVSILGLGLVRLGFLSRLDPERSTRGNRRVPLSGTQFPRLHPRTRKAYDIHFAKSNLVHILLSI